MSYIPPHKRHENVTLKASSVPPLPLHRNHDRNIKNVNTKIIYAEDSIRRWFLVSTQDNNFELVPVSLEWRKSDEEEKHLLILAKSDIGKIENPWLWLAKKIEDDLILGCDRAMKPMLKPYGLEDVNLRLIVRFGKVVFNRASLSKTIRDGLLTKTKLERLKKAFHTNVPKSYVENIVYDVVHKMRLCVEETKELYYVKVSDKTRPDVTISCKCKVDQEHKGLNFYKVNALRHLTLDASCLDQDLDLRFMVDIKRVLTNLSENEIKSLKEITDSAVIDSNVKGGLKWPLGKSSCGDGYSVCGVWHTVTTIYTNANLRLQIREADRYDFRTGIGRSSREVSLKLKALISKSREDEVERKCVSDMLKDCLKSVWDYFLKAM
ncbi:unnamed protein product [Cochlearia groenlandica]